MQILLVVTILLLGILTTCIYTLAIILTIKLKILIKSDAPRTRTGHPWKVSVIVPCKGWYPGLKDNLLSILEQDYPQYEVVFVTQIGDSSLPYIKEIVELSETSTKVLSIESNDFRSDKINNQLAGINSIDNRSKIIVFFDSDGFALPSFLSNLVAPLHEHDNVVTTSYRWFFPSERSIPIVIAKMCGAFAFLLQSSPWFTIPWGGAMAITVDAFKALQVEKEWMGALYDDYVLGFLLIRAKMRISFVPTAIVANQPLGSFRALFQEGKRHLFLLRVVFQKHWIFALVAVILVIFYPFLLLSIISRNEWPITPLMGATIGLSMPVMSTVIMRSVVSSCENLNSKVGHQANRIPHKYFTFSFVVPIILFIQILSSTFGKTIKWQNVTYEVTAYNETRVIR